MRTFARAWLAASVVLLAAGTASAAVVCNEDGDCWRVQGSPTYSRELRLRVQPDDWKWSDGERYRWREPGEGRGYYRSGVWVQID
jgi:hypothetical protein